MTHNTRPPALRILYLVELFPPAYRGGGPIRTAEAMVETHSGSHHFHVVCSDTDWGEQTPMNVQVGRWIERSSARVWYTRKGKLRSLLHGLIAGRATRPEFVYINGFLCLQFSLVPLLLARVGFFRTATLVVAARGEVGTAALAIKPLKKSVYISVLRSFGVMDKVWWHASSDIEAEEIKSIFPAARVAVRLNESLLPLTADKTRLSVSEQVNLVFIGRISRIKGVHILITAIRQCEARVNLDIFGSTNDPAYYDRCQELASDLPPNAKVIFHEAIPHDRVREAFSRADAFFLPTEHENFGHVIAEALSTGCPVYVEDVTPWTETLKRGGGHVVESHDQTDWTRALRAYCQLDVRARSAMKARAAIAFEEWRSQQTAPSVFQLIKETTENQHLNRQV